MGFIVRHSLEWLLWVEGVVFPFIDSIKTAEELYLCLRLDLDPGQLSALMMELGQGVTRNQRAERLRLGLSISPIDPALLDAAVRLALLLETPKDIPILALSQGASKQLAPHLYTAKLLPNRLA